jgi:hypothetical protein
MSPKIFTGSFIWVKWDVRLAGLVTRPGSLTRLRIACPCIIVAAGSSGSILDGTAMRPGKICILSRNCPLRLIGLWGLLAFDAR